MFPDINQTQVRECPEHLRVKELVYKFIVPYITVHAKAHAWKKLNDSK